MRRGFVWIVFTPAELTFVSSTYVAIASPFESPRPDPAQSSNRRILGAKHMPTYTRAEAERLLPKVRPLLEDLQRRVAPYRRPPTDPVPPATQALLRAITALGVEGKDPAPELIHS